MVGGLNSSDGDGQRVTEKTVATESIKSDHEWPLIFGQKQKTDHDYPAKIAASTT